MLLAVIRLPRHFAARFGATIDPTRRRLRRGSRACRCCRFWKDCLDEQVPPALGQLARALGALRPSLAFTENPSYVASPPSPTFLERYGYAVLVQGRPGSIRAGAAPDLALGVLLLGPETSYPTHVHPAAELYLPLGRAHWRTVEGRSWSVPPASRSCMFRMSRTRREPPPLRWQRSTCGSASSRRPRKSSDPDSRDLE